MKTVVYKADTRGYANHGWLEARHTFSFANYYDKERMNFGLLRVINDDIIAAGKGFGTHPHDNMEIITIPLRGDLAHKDSMGHEEVIKHGEVQVMSAGTGLTHSEYNANADRDVNIFQLWIYPETHAIKPRYAQKKFDFAQKKNDFMLIVSPNEEEGSLSVHQQTWLSIGEFDAGKTIIYAIRRKGNGVYAMVIEGEFKLGDTLLSKRDGMGIWEIDEVEITAQSDHARLLLIDVPMEASNAK